MRLKQSLLLMNLENINTDNKYSKAFLNLENVKKLEDKEKTIFPLEIQTKFRKLKEKFDNFLGGIPLKVVERYYIQHMTDMNHYCYFEYNGKELEDIKIVDLFILLERFYEEVFELSCEIANYYNLEIKLNNKTNSGAQEYI